MTEFELELKSIADVGLVGYPNVGKSTILSVVTAARPKIANYHFTTLAPNLGICRQYGMDFVMADIPGLVEGASEGVGLGIRFLRHVERTRLLVHVVDIAGSEGRDPIEDFEHICDELVAYGDLAERPQIVAANKMDLPGAEENLERLKKHLKGTDIEVYPVSAATQQGFDALMGAVCAPFCRLCRTGASLRKNCRSRRSSRRRSPSRRTAAITSFPARQWSSSSIRSTSPIRNR